MGYGEGAPARLPPSFFFFGGGGGALREERCALSFASLLRHARRLFFFSFFFPTGALRHPRCALYAARPFFLFPLFISFFFPFLFFFFFPFSFCFSTSAPLTPPATAPPQQVERNWWAMRYAAGGRHDDRPFILSVMKVEGRALKYASDRLRNDEEIVLAAIGNNPRSLLYASPELRTNLTFVRKAVRIDGRALRYADGALQDDVQLVDDAVMDGNLLKSWVQNPEPRVEHLPGSLGRQVVRWARSVSSGVILEEDVPHEVYAKFVGYPVGGNPERDERLVEDYPAIGWKFRAELNSEEDASVAEPEGERVSYETVE